MAHFRFLPFLPALLALFIHTAVITLDADNNRPREFTSVPPLTAVVEDAHKIICTTFSIDAERRYWMTAAHCLIEGVPVHIDGEVAFVVVSDPSVDVAVLRTVRTSARAIKLSKVGPRFGETVTIPGYPMGVMMLLTGTVANPAAEFTFGPPPTQRALFHLAGAKGGSGAPVLSKRGELVSIFQTTGQSAFDNGLVGGVVWRSLIRFARYFEGAADIEQPPVLQREQPVP